MRRHGLALHGAASPDPWLAVRGSVFRVSAYAAFHPGGARALLSLAGRDGTAAFEAAHRWVSADGVLADCRVGFLVPGGGGAARGGGAGGGEHATGVVESAGDGGAGAAGHRPGGGGGVGKTAGGGGAAGGVSLAAYRPVVLRWRRDIEGSGGGGSGGSGGGGGGGGALLRFELPAGATLAPRAAAWASTARALHVWVPPRPADAPLGPGAPPPPTLPPAFAASAPGATGYFDLLLAPSARNFELVAGVPPGGCVWVRAAPPTAASRARVLGAAAAGGGADADADAAAPPDAGLPPDIAAEVARGALVLALAPGAPSGVGAAWPGGGGGAVAAVALVARGAGVLPLLPLLAWASAGGEGGAPRVPTTLVWELPPDEAAAAGALPAVVDALGGGGRAGRALLCGAPPPGAAAAAAAAGLAVAPAAAPGLYSGTVTAGTLSRWRAAGVLPPADAFLLVAVCGGGGARDARARAWVDSLDDALRGAYYLAEGVVEVPWPEGGDGGKS